MLDKLNKISKLAQGSKLQRLLANPVKYVYGQYYRLLVYPRTKKGLLVKCDTFFKSEMTVLLPAGLDIYLLGAKGHESEVRLAKFIANTLKKGDNFVDVGAHFGYFSLLASKIVGNEGRVLSVEASRGISCILQQNIQAHKNIKGFNIACTDKNETLTFFEFPILYSEYNTLKPEQFEGAAWLKKNPPQEIKIQGKSLDTLLGEENLRPKFIKIDVEGAESQVIAGMAKTLAESDELYVAMEYLNDVRQNTSHVEAAKSLSNIGFQPHLITDAGTLESVTLVGIPKHFKAKGLDSDNIVFVKS